MKYIIPSSIPSRAFSRATVATYFDKNGALQVAAIDEPRFNYNPSALAFEGLLTEGASTNLLLNSLADGSNLPSQSVAVTVQEYTLSFYGSGSIILSSAHAVEIIGTSSTERTTYTFAPLLGTLFLTVSGEVKFANLEFGGEATSFIPTAGIAATRSQDSWTGQMATDLQDGAVPAAWSAATAYAAGNQVSYSNGVYESRQAANTNHTPTVAETDDWWIYVQPHNSWGMFDNVVETKSSKANRFHFALGHLLLNTSFAMLNVFADRVHIVGHDPETGEEIYNETVELIQDVADAWEWCFSAAKRKTALVKFDLPLFYNMILSVCVEAEGGTAEAGVCVLGNYEDIGEAEYDTSVEIVDYSLIRTDPFGRRSMTRRGWAKRLSIPVAIRSDQVDYTIEQIAQYRAQPLVFVATDQYTSTMVFGFYKNLKSIFKDYEMSRCNMEIEGFV